ncbi:Hypothetical Protein FCC1311_102452 [Hondaea fermentalgiana]|uniref:Calcineurin-like phosphoesterase domain-containing protein n=1 Tax=Hondaea fermentalgiana TaxID=2315210 RepID=A0A2R5GT36_9STRA|nr:Hypothetical Protein FCC1311_102452 [Hondaea fermentalgiana]|eukprot:GBG34022.1 Hypothetical Protein FCC1311_102452 [Hondaea fermentalgiana]
MADVKDRVVRWFEERLRQVQGVQEDASESKEGQSIRWLAILLGLMLFSYEAMAPLLRGKRSVYTDLRLSLIVWLFSAAMLHMPMASSVEMEDHPSVPFISLFILLLVVTHVTLAAFTMLHHLVCWALGICFPKLAKTLWVPGLRSVRSFKAILKGSILLSATVSLVFAYCGTVPDTSCIIVDEGSIKGSTAKQSTLAMLVPGADVNEATTDESEAGQTTSTSCRPSYTQDLSELVCMRLMPELDELWGKVGEDGTFHIKVLGVNLGQFSLLESPVGLLWLSGVAIWATYYTLRRTKRINQSLQRRAVRRRREEEARAQARTSGGLRGATSSAGTSQAIAGHDQSNNYEDEKDAEDAQDDLSSDDEYEDETKRATTTGAVHNPRREAAPTNFRPMAEWYSLAVTRTAFDLLISMKLFLGRFDMRTMQAAIGDGPLNSRGGAYGSCNPQERNGTHQRNVRTPDSIQEESFTFKEASASAGPNKSPQSAAGSTAETGVTDSLVDDRYADLDEMWFDWLADTGDGGNPTYAIARAVAQPSLAVPMHTAGRPQKDEKVAVKNLKRGDLLILGGDLAYPTPSRQEYASRLFQPFEYAMEPPPSYHRDDISLAKNVHDASTAETSTRFSMLSMRHLDNTRYSMPLGRMPRDRSMSNSNLLHGVKTPSSAGSSKAGSPMSGPPGLRPQMSEVFKVGDFTDPDYTEMDSVRTTGSSRSLFTGGSSVFSNDGNTSNGEDEESEDESKGPGSKKTARKKIAKSNRKEKRVNSGEEAKEEGAKVWQGPPCAYAIPGNHDWFDGLDTFMQCICYRDWIGGWRMPQSKSYFALKLPHGWWAFGLDFALEDDIDGLQYQYFASVAHRCLGENDQVILCSHEPTWLLDAYLNDPHPEDKPISRTSKNLKQLVRRHLRGRVAMRIAGDVHNYMRYNAEQPLSYSALRAGAAPFLVTSGGGGAFLHPTHTFPERYKEMAAYYKLEKAYPSFSESRMVGMRNLGQGFRMQNWRFDIVGSTVYFLIVCSFFPRCNLDRIMNAPHFYPEGLKAFGYEMVLIFGELFSEAYVSLVVTLIVYVTSFCFADQHHGTLRQLIIASVHTLAHVSCAVALFLLLEIVAELAIQDGLAGQGYDSIFEIFQNFERRTMPEAWWTNGLLETCMRFMLRIFDLPENMATTRVKICKGDVPAPGVGCAPLAPSQLSRFDFVSYYLGNYLYMYIIAADLGAMILGLYLYVCVTFFKLHWNEAFSSIRCEDYKTFTRFHIDADGDLHAYTIGIDRVPRKWRDDSRWTSTLFRYRAKRLDTPDVDELDPSIASYGVECPSRWIPAYEPNRKHRRQQDPRIVDYFCIPRKRSWLKPRRGKSTVSAGDWWKPFESLEQRRVFPKVLPSFNSMVSQDEASG